MAVADLDLLKRVVEHKTKFYYAGWARYELAIPGTLALIPTKERMPELQRDYAAMAVMLFADPPPLDDLLAEIARLEARINAPEPVG